jgi:hypothetical protein
MGSQTGLKLYRFMAGISEGLPRPTGETSDVVSNPGQDVEYGSRTEGPCTPIEDLVWDLHTLGRCVSDSYGSTDNHS